MKFYRYNNLIVSLNDVLSATINANTMRTSRDGKPTTVTHYAIVIDYTNGTHNLIPLPENNPAEANRVLDEIFKILTAK